LIGASGFGRLVAMAAVFAAVQRAWRDFRIAQLKLTARLPGPVKLLVAHL
jgi:hypothetical protein